MAKPSTRSDLVYTVLRRAVIEQALAPGAKLLEDEIGAHFGVSRTVVRAALQKLAGDGLVEMKAKRTATVARPSLEEARAIFEVRRCLEREAIRLLVERWKPEFGADLEGHVRDEEEAAKRQDKALSIRLAGEFHIRLAAMTGNPLLLRYVSEVVSRCSLILALYGRPHSSECGMNEHRDVIAALRSGDVARAVHVMDHHVALVEQRALIAEGGDAPDLGAIIGRYLPQKPAAGVVPLPARRRAGKEAS